MEEKTVAEERTAGASRTKRNLLLLILAVVVLDVVALMLFPPFP
jgi:hypothetical protein